MCITGTESQRILVMCMKQLGETLPMGAFDHKGHCIYANTPLASMLGYKLKVLKSKDISQLLPQPYGVMHLKYVKVRVTGTWGSTLLQPVRIHIQASTGSQWLQVHR